MVNVKIKYTKIRGCGWRKPGGLYFVAAGFSLECGKLPIELGLCPTCGFGIKQTRGFTWIDGDKFASINTEKCGREQFKMEAELCRDLCPFQNKGFGKVGLLWIGETYYKTPADFQKEVAIQGLSRRILTVPREFKLGETWIFLAHPKTMMDFCSNCDGEGIVIEKTNFGEKHSPCQKCDSGLIFQPGIFRIFKPTGIEYVVKGDETIDELEKLVNRGITPVKDIPQETQDTFLEESINE